MIGFPPGLVILPMHVRALAAALALLACAPAAPAVDSQSEQAAVLAWRQQRFESLTSDSGWLTLAGLLWLQDGSNSFGSGSGNDLVLDNPGLADTAGVFQVGDGAVSFAADPDGGVTLNGQSFDSVSLATDAGGNPTVLASGPLRFFVIARGGKLAVRVRDLDNPRRLEFRGLQYFPISTGWVVNARFVPYPAGTRIRIVNILGMEEDDPSPGAVVFRKAGRSWRLDTVQEPGESQLLIMFADGTSGRQTYGGGRFLYIPQPAGGRVQVDFNKAFNPPCALNDFATCPLPPPQNHLRQLQVTAGELTYAGAPAHAP